MATLSEKSGDAIETVVDTDTQVSSSETTRDAKDKDGWELY
jgi:hypothetical protein